MKYFKKLVGEKIYLSPVSTEDVEKFTEWKNDFNVTDYTGRSGSLTSFEAEKQYSQETSNNKIKFSIITLKDDKLIGWISLDDINYIHSTASLGIVIGEKEYLNQGYGTEAIMLIIDYGFNYLNLHRISLQLMSFNERALKCYQKCGFKQTGILREDTFINGKYYDSICMDILENEFTESYIKNKNLTHSRKKNCG